MTFDEYLDPSEKTKLGDSAIQKIESRSSSVGAEEHVRVAVCGLVRMRCYENHLRNHNSKDDNLKVLGQLKKSTESLSAVDAKLFAEKPCGISAATIKKASTEAKALMKEAQQKFNAIVDPVAEDVTRKIQKVKAWEKKCPKVTQEEKFTVHMSGKHGAEAITNLQKDLEKGIEEWTGVKTNVGDDEALGKHSELANPASLARAICLRSLYEYAILMVIRNPIVHTANGEAYVESLKSIIESMNAEELKEAKPHKALLDEADGLCSAVASKSKQPPACSP